MSVKHIFHRNILFREHNPSLQTVLVLYAFKQSHYLVAIASISKL